MDTDGDGLADVFEAGGSDADGDSVVDGFVSANTDGHDDNTAAGFLFKGPKPRTPNAFLQRVL